MKGHNTFPSLPPRKEIKKDLAAELVVSKHFNDSEIYEKHHFLMQVENYVGQLVEYYIASKCYATDNWAFCPSETVNLTDFIRKNEDGSFYFLNIKNKFNSENSASTKARKAAGVDKWYRIKSTGKPNWDKFPDKSLNLSEEEFMEFCSAHMENIS